MEQERITLCGDNCATCPVTMPVPMKSCNRLLNYTTGSAGAINNLIKKQY